MEILARHKILNGYEKRLNAINSYTKNIIGLYDYCDVYFTYLEFDMRNTVTFPLEG